MPAQLKDYSRAIKSGASLARAWAIITPMDSHEFPVTLIATITLSETLAGLVSFHKPVKMALITGEYFRPSIEHALTKLAAPPARTSVITVDGRSSKPSPSYSDASACFDTAYEAARLAKDEAGRSGGRVVCDFSEGTFLLRLGLLRAAEELGLPGVYRAWAEDAPLEVPRGEIDLQREQPFLFQQTLNSVEGLVNANRFDTAHFALNEALRSEAGSVDGKEIAFLQQLLGFVEALIKWDRFDYRGAARGLKPVHGQLAGMAGLPHAAALAGEAEKLLKWLDQVGGGVSSEYLAYDFLASAVRCAGRGAYSDAIMRLYRALEAYGQSEACRYFNVRSTESFPTELIPNHTRFFSGHPFYKHGKKMDLGMEATFAILRAAGSGVGERFARYYERPANEGMSLRDMQSMRNNSPLAHGSFVIGDEDFRRALKLINSFLGAGKRQSWELAPVVRVKLA